MGLMDPPGTGAVACPSLGTVPPHAAPVPAESGALGGGLLSSLISTLDSISGTASEDEGGPRARGEGVRQGVIDVDAREVADALDVTSILASTDLVGGDVEPCLDGSVECPVPWSAMGSGSNGSEGSGSEGDGGSAPAATAVQQQQ